MNRLRSLLLAAGALALAGCVKPVTRAGFHPPSGEARDLAALDGEMRRLMAAAQVTGLAWALIVDGRVVHQGAHGFADAASRKPLRTDSVMYGASLTKAAFAHLVLQLVDEGVLALDAPITGLLQKPLPEYADFADLAGDPRWRRFTPRMLLSHSSGLLNWRWINDDQKLDIKFEPGSRYVYSGEGIQVLQLIVEERTGASLRDLMQRRVFDRFGMADTSMVWRPDFEGRTANGHDAAGAVLGHARRGRPRAAGSMDTTLADYAKFMAGVLRGEGLSRASAREMLGPQIAIVSPQQFPSHWPGETEVNRGIRLSYGLGWGVYDSPAGPAFFKEGHDEGTNNFALGFLKSRSGIVLLSNSGNAERMFLPAVEAAFGKTCLPWFWMGYIPYTKPGLADAKAREHPVGPCGE